MALKDSIKHFRDVDNYNTYVEKKDIDDNFDILADIIDTKADKTIVGIITDGTTLKQQNDENKLAIGKDCEASGNYSLAYGEECKATADYSEAFGYQCEATKMLSYARGYQVKASGVLNFAYGSVTENKQDISIGYGISNGTMSKQNLKHYNLNKTTDETQKDFMYPIKLWVKSLNYIIIRAEILKDDYSTKWIFERKLIVRVDADGNVTIDSDDNTDIVKDDSDWKFDIESTDDSENPTLTLKATGKADTTIAWGIEVENRQTYFVG